MQSYFPMTLKDMFLSKIRSFVFFKAFSSPTMIFEIRNPLPDFQILKDSILFIQPARSRFKDSMNSLEYTSLIFILRSKVKLVFSKDS